MSACLISEHEVITGSDRNAWTVARPLRTAGHRQHTKHDAPEIQGYGGRPKPELVHGAAPQNLVHGHAKDEHQAAQPVALLRGRELHQLVNEHDWPLFAPICDRGGQRWWCKVTARERLRHVPRARVGLVLRSSVRTRMESRAKRTTRAKPMKRVTMRMATMS